MPSHSCNRPIPSAKPGGTRAGAVKDAGESELFSSAMGRYSFHAPTCRCGDKRKFAHHSCLRFLANVVRGWRRRKECIIRASQFSRLRTRRQSKTLRVFALRHWRKSERRTKQLRSIFASGSMRTVGKTIVLWRLAAAATRREMQNKESHLKRLRICAVAIWREYAAVRVAATRLREGLVLHGLERAIDCLARQRLVSRAIQKMVARLKGVSLKEWYAVCTQCRAGRAKLVNRWHACLLAGLSATWETRWRRTSLRYFIWWVRCVKVGRRLKLIETCRSRYEQRQILQAWALRADQFARARMLQSGQVRMFAAAVCYSWIKEVHSRKQATRAARFLCSAHLTHWRHASSQGKRAHRILKATKLRGLYLQLRTWCRYVQRVNAADELRRGIVLVELTQLFKVWCKYALAWKPVRFFRKNYSRLLDRRYCSHSLQRWFESRRNRKAVRTFCFGKTALLVR